MPCKYITHNGNCFINFHFSVTVRQNSDTRGKRHRLDLRHTSARNKLSVTSRIDSFKARLGRYN